MLLVIFFEKITVQLTSQLAHHSARVSVIFKLSITIFQSIIAMHIGLKMQLMNLNTLLSAPG